VSALRPLIRRSALSCLLALTALVVAAPANAAPLFGFNDMLPSWGQIDPAANVAMAKNAGATTSLITVNWREAEPAPGVLRLSNYDAAYNASIAKGIKPVFGILFSPAWTWSSACTGDCRLPPAPEHYGDWRAFVTTLVKRYPLLAGIQVWNEPNFASFWQRGIDPERYTALVKEAYKAVKAVKPSMPVIAGALTNYAGEDRSNYMPQTEFLKRMYAAGLKGNADAISIHPYPDDIDPWQFYKALSEIRDVRDAAGAGSTKLWVTEVGVSSKDPTNRSYVFNENDQAVTNGRLVQKLKAMPDVAAAIVHTLVPTDVNAREEGFGVVNKLPGLAPKPAFCELARINATAYKCPAGVSKTLTTDPVQAKRWQAQDLLQAAADAARTYRAQRGSYAGLTSAGLRALSPQISATPAAVDVMPGASAKPERIAVFVWGAGAEQNLLLCNTSTADRSYCIWSVYNRFWTYGKAESAITVAADGILTGRTAWW
jgi:hypothetical protein